MSKKFTVEVEQFVCIDAEVTAEDLVTFIESHADSDDLEKISIALDTRRGAHANGGFNTELIENASEIIQDVLRELMLVGESAAIEMLRYEMRKQGVQVFGGAK